MDLFDVDGRAVVRFLPWDVLAVLVFVLLGELQHQTLSAQRYAGTLIPFLVGWLLVAPVAGAYAERVRDSARAALLYAVVAWLGADFVGQVLRGTEFFPGNAGPQFFLVAFVFGGLLLVAARFVALVVADLLAD